MAISFVPCKEIRIPKSGKYLLLESGIRENFATGIRNTAKDCNPESKFHRGVKNRETPTENLGPNYEEVPFALVSKKRTKKRLKSSYYQ